MKKVKKCEINNCNKNMVSLVGVGVPPFCEYHNGKFFEYSANNFLNLKPNSLKNMEKNKDFRQVFILEQINNFKKLYENKDKKE
ncbi:hypothetical protein [Spiroplasma poulsonii]|uniref:hypothetical protein n=1 Tax=Spiroplasma poulsonii TaxID=2138 RepID=UPI001F4C751D|nr:hypothetical protein [Spiroplasma poulsonii]UNF62699.1 hypothetical protein MNU24_08310 [Spiroplasma poulsonii]